MAHRTPPDLTRTLAHADAVHGLYYLLAHALFRLFRDADPLLVLRLPSVLATTVTAGLLTLLGTRLAGPRAGTLAGLTFAVLPPVQRYTQEGRSYALVCTLVVGATYLLERTLDTAAPRTTRAWAGYGAVLLAACLLHEFAVLVLAAHAVAVPREARRAWLKAAGAVVVAVAPLAVLSKRQSAQVAWIGGLGAGALLSFGAMALLGCACAVRLPRALVRFALPLTVLPAGLLMLVSLVKPLYVDRYVLYGQAGTALLIGAALDRLTRAGGARRAAALLAVGAALATLVPVAVYLRTPDSRLDDATAVDAAVRAAGADADGILYLPARRRIWALADPDAVRGLRDLALDRTPAASGTLYGTEADPSVIRARLLAARRIVVLRDPAGQPLDATSGEVTKRRTLAEGFEECGTRTVHGARVSVYARRC
ncbi:glycosyltransferase family 39 protein [Streptomyces sp. GbtcB6]|uniref:glycosyltransferase family 39 protein n=1 Tax=Streptomyces sp. GbtcB6 TaxID=2824751 RepID=UPI001C30D226|nr:glycosyltransferase family 39 protein [Streptomyces sp. GbtcB6]